jgi:phosphoribosylformylglycinamidine (FGAM) synthase PurS component
MPAVLAAHTNGKTKVAPTSGYRVEVFNKPGFSDASGAAVIAQLPSLGIQSVTDVKVAPIYDIRGHYSLGQMITIAKELLADPITQDFAIYSQWPTGTFWGPHWRIEVWLKSTVSDPVESSLHKAIQDLGLSDSESARMGTVYKLWGRLYPCQAEKIATKLLANPVVHRCTVESC